MSPALTRRSALALLPMAAMSQAQTADPARRLLLCGGNVVYDAQLIKSGKGFAWGGIRTWFPERSNGLPLQYALRPFTNTDDCKPVDAGRSVLVTASSGGVAIFNRQNLETTFYATVPNAHSACLVSEGFVAVASSTAPDGNHVALFRRDTPEKEVCRVPLESAHGVEWDIRRNVLYALGLNQLNVYRVEVVSGGQPVQLILVRTYRLPAKGGHELSPGASDDELLVSADRNVWSFDKNSGEFHKHPQLGEEAGIKCVSLHRPSGLIAYVQCEDLKGRWWTFYLRFAGTESKLESPGQRLYKVRWG